MRGDKEQTQHNTTSTEIAPGTPETTSTETRTDPVVALIAHELRSPLGAIRLAAYELHLGGNDPTTRNHVEGVLDRQTRHMSHLIEGMLDLARIGQGKIQLIKEHVELSCLIEVAIEAVRSDLEKRGHLLKVVLPPDPVNLEADATRLIQVFINLLDNAAKYTTSPGRIEMTVVREGKDVVIRFRDSGIGIAPEMLPHVFEPFWQASQAPDHSVVGLGIGLSLVRQLVEMHGGSIQAASAGHGQGSEFVVNLPRILVSDPCVGT